jgi:hypothetical protein
MRKGTSIFVCATIKQLVQGILGFLFYVLFGNIVAREIKYYLLRYNLSDVDTKVKDNVQENGTLWKYRLE